MSPRSSCAGRPSGNRRDGSAWGVPLLSQFALVGFWIASAESGLLPLAARSTEFTDPASGIRDVQCGVWRKFP
jgi:hypothetical protein